MSRKIEDLHPRMQPIAVEFIEECERQRWDVLIYFTLRTLKTQAKLYRKGRTIKQIRDKGREWWIDYGRKDLGEVLMDVGPQRGNKIVTRAGPGQSLHNYGYAFDAVPLRDGKPVWGTESPADLVLWSNIGTVGISLGLVWGGTWEKFRDFPHFQMQGVSWKELIKN